MLKNSRARLKSLSCTRARAYLLTYIKEHEIGHMEISAFDWKNVWQVACGDTTRDYRNLFFNFSLMSIACEDDEGPYDQTARAHALIQVKLNFHLACAYANYRFWYISKLSTARACPEKLQKMNSIYDLFRKIYENIWKIFIFNRVYTRELYER